MPDGLVGCNTIEDGPRGPKPTAKGETNMANEYRFEPYDVLQISRANGMAGTWLDFSTIRTADDAQLAVDIVETNGRSSGFSGRFRIMRRDHVIFEGRHAFAV
jgi:hypothetical protein